MFLPAGPRSGSRKLRWILRDLLCQNGGLPGFENYPFPDWEMGLDNRSTADLSLSNPWASPAFTLQQNLHSLTHAFVPAAYSAACPAIYASNGNDMAPTHR